MPLILPDKLPAIELLKKENIIVDDSSSEQKTQTPLRVAVLNLMPLKIDTETDLVRLLSSSP